MNQYLWLEWHSAKQHVQKLDTPRLQLPRKCMSKGGQVLQKGLCRQSVDFKRHCCATMWLYNGLQCMLYGPTTNTMCIRRWKWHLFSIWEGGHTKARLWVLGRRCMVWTQRSRNTSLLGDAVHGWARTLLTTTSSAQMVNASFVQRLAERF